MVNWAISKFRKDHPFPQEHRGTAQRKVLVDFMLFILGRTF
jgi:hypothetical protein